MNKPYLKIAFGCEARVGKSEACLYLKTNYGGTEISFSKSIYDIMYYAQDVCSFEKKKDRDFLQKIGTWGRNQDENIWVYTS